VALIVAASFLAVGGCDSDDAMPTDADLVGLWVNVDAGQVRAFRFLAAAPPESSAALTAKPFVYELYFYAAGSAPAIAQRGHYSVRFERLVTEVVEAPLDPSQVGRMFGNDVRGFTGRSVTLESESAASGERIFKLSTALP